MENVTVEQLKEYLAPDYSLSYVDYRDNLIDCLSEVQEAIWGSSDKIHERIGDAFLDQEHESETEAYDKFISDFSEKAGIDENEARELAEPFEDQIKDEIWNRDISDKYKDLIRNTGEIIMFFDTGCYIEESMSFGMAIYRIKRALKINPKDKTFNHQLFELVENAPYGGRLVVYFRDRLHTWLKHDLDQWNQICFDGDVHIAIVNNGNGSGHDVTIGHSFWKNFRRDSIFIDKITHYSYSYEVCGMIERWCESTKVQLAKKKGIKKPPKSSIHVHLEREAQYEKTFREGKCTFGDMNIRRHRNTPYRNEFPCGNKCVDCGTFWID